MGKHFIMTTETSIDWSSVVEGNTPEIGTATIILSEQVKATTTIVRMQIAKIKIDFHSCLDQIDLDEESGIVKVAIDREKLDATESWTTKVEQIMNQLDPSTETKIENDKAA